MGLEAKTKMYRQGFLWGVYILSFSTEQCIQVTMRSSGLSIAAPTGVLGGGPVRAVVSLGNEPGAGLGEEVWANLVKMRDFLSESVVHQSG